MVQHIGRDDRLEARSGEGQTIDAAAHHRRARFGRGATCRFGRPLQADRLNSGQAAQPGEQAAGAAARVQHPAADASERVAEAGMQGAVPPHVVFGRIHPCVFACVHPRNSERAGPARIHRRRRRCRRRPPVAPDDVRLCDRRRIAQDLLTPHHARQRKGESRMGWGVLLDWVSLIVRWTHVVAAIAWIGSSFYFIALDASLKPHPRLDKRVAARRGRCTAAASTRSKNTPSRRSSCRRTSPGSSGRPTPPGSSASCCWCWCTTPTPDLYLIDTSVANITPWDAVPLARVLAGGRLVRL